MHFHISVVAAMEFLEGFSNPAKGERLLDPFKQVVFNDHMARRASWIRRELRESGKLIGDLDILIAATAMQMGEPLVTANEAHFKRISGLDCISYR
jgi:predicted nucleic acid-binding protein